VCLEASGQRHEVTANSHKQGLHNMEGAETVSFPTTVLLHEVSGGKDDGSPVTCNEGTEGRYWYSCLPTRILGASWWPAQCPGTFTPARDPVPTEQETRCASGTVRMGPDNLASTGVRTPDRPARSESLHRLCHDGRLLQDRLHLK
jgi:hypothetical protein